MEHAEMDDQIFSPQSTATGGGTVELPTAGAQLRAPPSPHTTSAQCPLPCLQLTTRKYRARGRIVAVIVLLTLPCVHVPDC